MGLDLELRLQTLKMQVLTLKSEALGRYREASDAVTVDSFPKMGL